MNELLEQARKAYPMFYISETPPITRVMEVMANLGMSVAVHIDAGRQSQRFGITLPGGRLTDTDDPDGELYQYFAGRFSEALKNLAAAQNLPRATR